jgi:hypothetical protein
MTPKDYAQVVKRLGPRPISSRRSLVMDGNLKVRLCRLSSTLAVTPSFLVSQYMLHGLGLRHLSSKTCMYSAPNRKCCLARKKEAKKRLRVDVHLCVSAAMVRRE